MKEKKALNGDCRGVYIEHAVVWVNKTEKDMGSSSVSLSIKSTKTHVQECSKLVIYCFPLIM